MLKLTNLTQKLHTEALQISKEIRKYESQLLDILDQLDRRKGFMEFGYSSLFQYVVESLGLSEARASNFITVARKSREIPELKEGVRSWKFSVSKARKITPVLTKENKEQWLMNRN